MVIKNVNLETVCGITSVLPKNTKPEIAFAGKSNVGKSSLINALMNRKSYARISATPGKTQTINYYSINDEMYLVDLPGYGYAKVSEQEKIKWGQLIERYLHSSAQLKAVFLLIDIRHAPSENDRIMYQWIVDQGFHPIIIATKLDKIKRSQVNRMGLVKDIKEPKKVEMELWKIIPPEEGNDFCHRLVEHGRDVCTARTTPHCDRCVLNDICATGKKLMKAEQKTK